MVPASITTALLANVWTDTQVRYAMTDMFKKFSCHYFLILFPGEYCEIDASVCNETICKNFGECIEGPGFSFYCRCREGKKFVILTYVKNILLLRIFYSIIMYFPLLTYDSLYFEKDGPVFSARWMLTNA